MEDSINQFMIWFFLRWFKVILIIVFAFLVIKIGRFAIKKGVNSFIENGRKILKKNKEVEKERVRTIIRALNSTFRIVVITIAILTILPEININIGPLLAGAGIAGLAIGMGARNLIQDYFSGLYILIEDQYRVGEEVNILGTKGTVFDFSLRRTVIKGEDKSLHIIPNGQINKVNNLSRK